MFIVRRKKERKKRRKERERKKDSHRANFDPGWGLQILPPAPSFLLKQKSVLEPEFSDPELMGY